MRKLIVISLFLLLAVFRHQTFADILYLENGSTVKGNLVREDQKQVVFMVGGEGGIEVTFFKDEIIRIDKEDSNGMVNLKFGEDKEVSVPLPDFSNRKPLITEQARIQAKSMQQSETDITGALSDMDAINEELMPLLTKAEIDYFREFTVITKESASRISASVTDIGAISADKDKLAGLVGSSMLELENVINKLKQLVVPVAFHEFHDKYLKNLESLKNIYTKMQSGQIATIQDEMQVVMENNKVLKEELDKVLTLKKLTKTE